MRIVVLGLRERARGKQHAFPVPQVPRAGDLVTHGVVDLLREDREAPAEPPLVGAGAGVVVAILRPPRAHGLLHPRGHAAVAVEGVRVLHRPPGLEALRPHLRGRCLGHHHILVLAPGAHPVKLRVVQVGRVAALEPVVVVHHLEEGLLVLGPRGGVIPGGHGEVLEGLPDVVGPVLRAEGAHVELFVHHQRHHDEHGQDEADGLADRHLGHLLADLAVELPAVDLVFLQEIVLPVVGEDPRLRHRVGVRAAVGPPGLPHQRPLPPRLAQLVNPLLPLGVAPGLVELEYADQPEDADHAGELGAYPRGPSAPQVARVVLLGAAPGEERAVRHKGDVQQHRERGDDVQPEEEAARVVFLAEAGDDDLEREDEKAPEDHGVEARVHRLVGEEEAQVIPYEGVDRQHGSERDELRTVRKAT
mmetsp:Transcript_37101/g.104163  ORF Transcript_37101/g.104163 Transcript_37101/m.104163 type:complete len:418 (+) Transcript_37101:2233-3486(+)